MRALLVNLLILLTTAGAGAGVCAALGRREMLIPLALAAGAILAATLVASAPLLLARGADQLGAVQAGLLSTLAHLLVGIALAGVILFTIRPGHGFVYWLMGFYWLTLGLLATSAARAVRAAPPVRAAPKH